MSLQAKIADAMKTAMKTKNTIALEALRAIKSELLLAQTSGANAEITEADEVKLLQKMIKQRKNSADIFTQQGRQDLAEPELAQVSIIEEFLPAQLSEEEVENIVKKIIEENGFSGMQSMGQVMSLANAQLSGSVDGKTISTIVKKLLA